MHVWYRLEEIKGVRLEDRIINARALLLFTLEKRKGRCMIDRYIITYEGITQASLLLKTRLVS